MVCTYSYSLACFDFQSHHNALDCWLIGDGAVTGFAVHASDGGRYRLGKLGSRLTFLGSPESLFSLFCGFPSPPRFS